MTNHPLADRPNGDDQGLREDHLAAAMRVTEVGIWSWNTRTDDIDWSPEMYQIHGVQADDVSLSSSSYTSLVHPDDAGSVAATLDQVRVAGGKASVEYRVQRPNGELRHLVVRAHRDEAHDGQIRGVVIDLTDVVIDLTDRRHSEAALGEAVARETQAAQVLRQLNEQKDVFLQTVSHDLRNPLAVIESFATLLRDRDSQISLDERHEYATRIVDASRRMHRQLTDLLDLDRLSRGVLEPNRRPTDLVALACESVAALDLARRTNVTGEPLVADVDPGQVERILENLLANSARHAGPDGRITVRIARHDAGVLVSVDDDGPGVPASMREAVFDVFRTGHRATAGTGIGLSLVRRFAELHGGRAWIEEAPEGGASVKVVLAARVR